MRKSMTVVSLRVVLGCWFIAALFVFGNIPALKAEDTSTVEGVWIVVSANPLTDVSRADLNHRLAIARMGETYELKWLDGPRSNTTAPPFFGSELQIAHQYDTALHAEGKWVFGEQRGSDEPPSLQQELAGKTYPQTVSYTLSPDGRFLYRAEDSVRIFWDNGHYTHYEILPGYFKETLKRVSGPATRDATNRRFGDDAVATRETLAAGNPRKSASALNEQGVQYYMNKQWQQAVDAFKAALDKSPDDQKILRNYELASRALAAELSESRSTPNVPSTVHAGQPSVVSLPRGFYSLDPLVDFDTLDQVTCNSVKGTLSLSGHRMRKDRQADVAYLNLLADALDSDKPIFSLEWTASSQREVDRALAYYADDRNNEDITTRLSNIFDADGRLNRKGASFLKAFGVDVHEGMNHYEVNSSLLTASGHKDAGRVLRAFGGIVEVMNGNDEAAKTRSLEGLAKALGLYDFVAENAGRFRNGQITEVQLMDLVWPRILSGMAHAFGWDDSPYVDKYWRLRRSGSSCEEALNGVLLDMGNDQKTLMRKALDAITAKTSEIVVPPDVMREVLGAEPRVRPVLKGLPDRTRLALTACEADVFCKSLFEMPGLQAKVPRYQGYFAWLRDRGQHPVTGEGHLWTSPGDFELLESTDGQTLRFGRTPMKFRIEKYEAGRRSVANPQLSAYADLLTTCYDDIAREYPVLHQLRECTKMVAVAQWLKQRGYSVSLPRAGREGVNLPAELPGVIYMVMAVKNGPVGEILTAAGGVDFCGDNGWRYTPRDIPSLQTDLVDWTARQIREKVEQIFRRKIEAPMPQPMAEVKSEEIGGQKVTTVTVAMGAGTEGPAPAMKVQRSPEEEALRVWKAEDLAGAEQAYRKLIESAAGDVRYAASLRALLAQVLHEKGDDAAAIKELSEAVRLAPDLPILQLLYAQGMVQGGDLPGAEAALRKYLALDPDNQAAARLLADVQARQKGGAGAPAAALAAFPKALEGAPSLDGPAGTAPSTGAAEGGTALDQAHTSRETTKQGLDRETPEGRTTGRNEDASVLNEQGVQYYMNKQWQQAVDAFKAALDKSPDDQKIRRNYELASRALAAQLAESGSTPPAAGGGTALDQAHTSNKETRQGLDSGKLELMKEQSNKVFDNPVPLQSSEINPAVDLRNVGKAPWPAFVRNDKEIIQMQKNRDAFLATQQKKDAELTELRKQIEAATDSETKSDLMVKAAQLKAESSQAEYQAALKDKEIQKRAKLLIDTQVKETPPASKDKKTP